MDRLWGFMPSNEIEKTVTFKDMLNHKIHIGVGPNGWTIIWADGHTNYKDESIGTEANYKNALECLHKHFPEDELVEISEIDHHFSIDPEDDIDMDYGEETLETNACDCKESDYSEAYCCTSESYEDDDGAEFN